MSEYQRETAFLRQVIAFDDTDERRHLEQRIKQLKRDERCVQRAALLMALLAALGVAALGYDAVFEDNFGYGTSQLVIKLVCELGLASLISLVAMAGLLVVYRFKLCRLREECRRLVTNLLESRLGKAPKNGNDCKQEVNLSPVIPGQERISTVPP